MTKQVKAKIFVADERGINETPWFESRSTFNFGSYNNEHKKPFGNLYVLNDDMLDGGRSLKMQVEEAFQVIIFPVAGAIKYSDNLGNDNLVVAGQAQAISFPEGGTYEISNPFKDQWVNFLQVWIKTESKEESSKNLFTYPDVNSSVNNLVPAIPGGSLFIGKFSGRGETLHKTKAKKDLFVFVLEGAFEVEGRLLHRRDGLALYNVSEIDMEALSNEALLLVIE